MSKASNINNQNQKTSIALELANVVDNVKSKAFTKISSLGVFILYLRDVFYWTFHKPFRRDLLFQQLEFIGNQSLLVVFISSFFVGAALGMNIGGVFEVFGAESMVGAASAKALSREIAPLITLVLVTGRAGSAITAEISTMKVNEQVDAMEAMAVDPISYLVVPRFLACVIIIPMLTAVFIFVGVVGSYFAGTIFFEVDQGLFISKLRVLMEPMDLFRGLAKSLAFAVMMGSICCQYGLNASGGAKGVGKATTNSVVVTLLAILGIDVVITYFQIIW